MNEEMQLKQWDIIQHYMELSELIPDENGGRLLKLIIEKHQKLFFELTDKNRIDTKSPT